MKLTEINDIYVYSYQIKFQLNPSRNKEVIYHSNFMLIFYSAPVYSKSTVMTPHFFGQIY